MFGGLSVLLFGDILQLPPVKASHVFNSLRSYDLQKYFNSVAPGLNLWKNLFDYRELTENMRQREDLVYAGMMGRMRVQQLNAEDLIAFKSRIIPISDPEHPTEETADFYVDLIKIDERALAIFSTNDEVAQFNASVANSLNLDMVIIEADDSWERRSTSTNVIDRLYQRVEFNLAGPTKRKSTTKGAEISKGAGLEKVVTLAIGGRVMLRRNVDQKLGLINGATGVLQQVLPDVQNPLILMVTFIK